MTAYELRISDWSSDVCSSDLDKSRWDGEAAIILAILNDAWSGNWGFVPFTPEEVAYAGKKLRPIVFEPLNYIAELDGKPVAFMLTFPDINDVLKAIRGRLFPFGWFRLQIGRAHV